MAANSSSSSSSTPIPLLTPYKMGKFNLSHRIVFPPLSRNRSFNNTPQPHATEYYSQRTSPGGLLISEAAAAHDISTRCPNFPGIWKKEQVEAWKPIVDGVHDEGGVFFCQLWHSGRFSHFSNQYFLFAEPEEEGECTSSLAAKEKYGHQISFSTFIEEGVKPRQLTVQEIRDIINDFKVAARNAIEAGFDGVEILGANGYLIDQFMKEEENDRNDEYGGSLENRCRFGLQVMKAVAQGIGAERVGIKLNPYDYYNKSSDPEKLGVYMANELSQLGILYLHVAEPRQIKVGDKYVTPHCLLPLRKAFKGTLIASGGYDKSLGDKAVAEDYADLISFGRLFLANPDLPKRFALNAPLNKHNRSTFYVDDPVVGYTDYPFLEVAS